MLIQRDRASLLVIDLQAGLLPHIVEGDQLLAHSRWLIAVASRLGVPVVVTEQNPDRLGTTVAAALEVANTPQVVAKMHFSAVADGCLAGTAVDERPQVVVCGSEAHVCVLQTVLDLAARGQAVFVVAEAVGSRRANDRQLALERMRDGGVTLVSREMVAFEWLRLAGTDEFREVSRNFIR